MQCTIHSTIVEYLEVAYKAKPHHHDHHTWPTDTEFTLLCIQQPSSQLNSTTFFIIQLHKLLPFLCPGKKEEGHAFLRLERKLLAPKSNTKGKGIKQFGRIKAQEGWHKVWLTDLLLLFCPYISILVKFIYNIHAYMSKKTSWSNHTRSPLIIIIIVVIIKSIPNHHQQSASTNCYPSKPTLFTLHSTSFHWTDRATKAELFFYHACMHYWAILLLHFYSKTSTKITLRNKGIYVYFFRGLEITLTVIPLEGLFIFSFFIHFYVLSIHNMLVLNKTNNQRLFF